jgi:hypothetical protein
MTSQARVRAHASYQACLIFSREFACTMSTPVGSRLQIHESKYESVARFRIHAPWKRGVRRDMLIGPFVYTAPYVIKCKIKFSCISFREMIF